MSSPTSSYFKQSDLSESKSNQMSSNNNKNMNVRRTLDVEHLSVYRRNSDTVLMHNSNQYLKLPFSNKSKKVRNPNKKNYSLNENSTSCLPAFEETKSGQVSPNSSCIFNSLLHPNSMVSIPTQYTSINNNQASSPTSEKSNRLSPNGSFYGSFLGISSSISSSSLQSNQSIFQKCSSINDLEKCQNICNSKLNDAISETNTITKLNSTNFSIKTQTFTSKKVSKCFQNINSKFTRKRHSVSILKTNNTTSNNLKPNQIVIPNNTQMTKKLSTSLNNKIVENREPSPSASPSRQQVKLDNKLEIPTAFFKSSFKFPFKIKSNVTSRRNSFKRKKRSKSAPNTQRPTNKSNTIYALVTKDHSDKKHNYCVCCENKITENNKHNLALPFKRYIFNTSQR